MQTLKNEKSPGGESLSNQINRFLFHYRLTPHSTTGTAPTELLLRRRPHSHLNFLFPDVADRVRKRQSDQKTEHDRHSRERQLCVGQPVWVRNLPACLSWLPGTISQVRGPQRFRVILADGRALDRHIDHVRLRTPTSPETISSDALAVVPVPELQEEDRNNDPSSNSRALDPLALSVN